MFIPDDFISYSPSDRELIISELKDMFLVDSIALEAVAPLSWDAVVTELLFPETIVLLLQDKLRIDVSGVLCFLRKKNVGNRDYGHQVCLAQVSPVAYYYALDFKNRSHNFHSLLKQKRMTILVACHGLLESSQLHHIQTALSI